MTPPVALTIAGSDSGGGAGIQADLKTFVAQQVYGACAVTAVTAQNTHGVSGVYPVPAAVVRAQLTAVVDDLQPAAVKVGMLGSDDTASVVVAFARRGVLPNLVLDPVLTSTSGARLGATVAVQWLLPYATVVTPNRDEASALLGQPVDSLADMADAAARIAAMGVRYVVVTGGELPGGEAVDALWTETGVRYLRAPRIETGNTHGTGCTFSAAIAARLACGDPVPEAAHADKSYVSRALAGAARWQLGSGGYGPLDHLGFGETGEGGQ